MSLLDHDSKNKENENQWVCIIVVPYYLFLLDMLVPFFSSVYGDKVNRACPQPRVLYFTVEYIPHRPPAVKCQQ